ncbi:hypothetical protein BH11PSE4_BH11PSE4_36090 [soil metagenome]
MTSTEQTRNYRRDLLLASVMVVSGLALSVMSVAQVHANSPQLMAQATQPLQSTPGAANKPMAPETPESETTGTRPAAIPPQPARPDADAQEAGAKAALPPAPAEKMAPPITTK